MSTNTNANPLETGTDEIERFALEECIKRQRVDRRVSVLVMPAGRCEQAFKFARLGAQLTVADTPELKQDIEGRILAAGLPNDIRFAPFEFPDLPAPGEFEPFDIIVLRRGLSAMPYAEARQYLKKLLGRLKIGGKLFISILGIHSELGEGYGGIEQRAAERWSKLSTPMAKKYGIQVPVCLYSERDLFMLLLESGASVLRTLTTTYGNVKGVAVRV